jgi:hypothetical protein
MALLKESLAEALFPTPPSITGGYGGGTSGSTTPPASPAVASSAVSRTGSSGVGSGRPAGSPPPPITTSSSSSNTSSRNRPAYLTGVASALLTPPVVAPVIVGMVTPPVVHRPFSFSRPKAKQKASSDMLFQCYLEVHRMQHLIPPTTTPSTNVTTGTASTTPGVVATRTPSTLPTAATATTTPPPSVGAAGMIVFSEDDFADFLKMNPLFSSRKAISSFLSYFVSHHGMSLLLRMAHHRRQMKRCLELIARYGAHHLSAADFTFIIDRGYAPLLLYTSSGGHIFRCLPAWQQLETILREMASSVEAMATSGPSAASMESAAPRNVKETATQIATLLTLIPRLDPASLVRLANFADPARGIIWAQRHPPSKGALLELFISTLLPLQSHRARWHRARRHRPLASKMVEEKAKSSSTPASAAAAAAAKRGTRAVDDIDEEEHIYTQDDLESALRKYYGEYRIALIIPRCIDWNNWQAAAVVYEAGQQWSDALECRLAAAAYASRHSKARTTSMSLTDAQANASAVPIEGKENKGESESKLAPSSPSVTSSSDVPLAGDNGEKVMALVQSHLIRIPNHHEKARLLSLLMSYWNVSGLPFARLEQYLVGSLSSISDALSMLIFNPLASQPPSSASAASDAIRALPGTSNHNNGSVTTAIATSSTPFFSARLYLAVTQHRLNQLHASSTRQHQQSSTHRLWAEILLNLNKDLHRRSFTTFSALHMPRRTVGGSGGVGGSSGNALAQVERERERARALERDRDRERERKARERKEKEKGITPPTTPATTPNALSSPSSTTSNSLMSPKTKSRSSMSVRRRRKEYNDDLPSTPDMVMFLCLLFIHSVTCVHVLISCCSDHPQQEVIAFTCGHAYRRRDFYEEILPEFLVRMATLQPRIPITTKLFHAEYQQKVTFSILSTCCHVYTYYGYDVITGNQSNMSSMFI